MTDIDRPKPLIEIFGDVTVVLNGTLVRTRAGGGFTAQTADGKLIAAYAPDEEPFDILCGETQPDLARSGSGETSPPRAQPVEYQSDSGNEENVSWPLGVPRPPIA